MSHNRSRVGLYIELLARRTASWDLPRSWSTYRVPLWSQSHILRLSLGSNKTIFQQTTLLPSVRSWNEFFFYLKFYFMFMVLCTYRHVYQVCEMPTKCKRGRQILWNWSYWELKVLGIEQGSWRSSQLLLSLSHLSSPSPYKELVVWENGHRCF